MAGTAHIMPDTVQIEAALKTLHGGGLAILPTETVYGLAARADMPNSVARIYELKGRDFDKPLALCVENLDMAKDYADMSGLAGALAQTYWPGPLSLVVKARNTGLSPHLYGRKGTGEKTISLRCPQASWRPFINGLPLALTSANPSGQDAPLNIRDAKTAIGQGVDTTLSGPPCALGISSTILAIEGRHARVLRQGSLTLEDFNAFDIEWISE